LWNGQDKPPLSVSEVVENGAISKRALITRAGHKLIFTDDSDKGVTLETSGGHKLFLQDEAKKVTVETSGGHKIVLDDNAGSIQIDSSRDLTIKSGANLTIEATAKLELKGATFNLQASGAGEVKSSGTLQMQGALVKIN
jgi:hypothetical protein